jgi:nucleoside-diphosphate-sugar epimerase
VKALVTGAASFIGSHLTAALLDKEGDGGGHRLFRLLSARDQGTKPRREPLRQGFRFAETALETADLPALLMASRTCRIAAQAGVRKSWARTSRRIRSTTSRRPSCCSKPAVDRLIERFVHASTCGLWRPRGNPDARGRAAAACVAYGVTKMAAEQLVTSIT